MSQEWSRVLPRGTIIFPMLFACASFGHRAWGDDEVKLPVPELAVFQEMIGSWDVTERHLDKNGQEAAVAKGTEEVLWELDQRAIRRVYATSTNWRAYRAIGFLAWNEATQRLEGTWFDNASRNGPTLVTGRWDPVERTFTYTLRAVGDDGSAIILRVVDRFISDKERQAVTYLVEGEKTTKQLEVEYKRPPPCPGAHAASIGELPGK